MKQADYVREFRLRFFVLILILISLIYFAVAFDREAEESIERKFS